MELYISNLNTTTTEEQLRQLLAPFSGAKCSTIRTVSDSTKDNKNTFAYIHLDDPASAKAIISKLDNMHFLERTISVKEAR